jgi:hypothetical protein
MLKRRNIVHGAWCIALAGIAVVGQATAARAQDPPPRIGPFVVDLHGVVPTFSDDPLLAQSRSLLQPEMPGWGLGLTAGVHVYLPKVLGIVFGVGGEVLAARSHFEPPELPPATTTSTAPATTPAGTRLRPVTETLKSISPQLSMNFGNGNGWSYLSVGMGRSIWSIVPEGGTPFPVDEEVIRTINYGGGARWFAKKHLAFSVDARLYEIDNGTPVFGFPGSPRKLLLVVGAGISIK